MRTSNFGLIVMFSCVAVVGAAPIGNISPVEALAVRQDTGVPGG